MFKFIFTFTMLWIYRREGYKFMEDKEKNMDEMNSDLEDNRIDTGKEQVESESPANEPSSEINEQNLDASESDSADESNEENTAEINDNTEDKDEKPSENDDGSDNGETDSSDSNAAENDEVKYETNDNWQFEAEAPTLNNEIELGNDGDLIIEEEHKETVNTKIKQASKKPESKEKVENVPEKGDIVIKKKSFKIFGYALLAVIVVAVLVVFGIFYYTLPNSNEKMNPGNIALDVDGTKVSVGMYNYYYDYLVQNYETYASYGYYDLDTTASYDEQYTTDDDGNQITWAQRFEDDAVYQIKYLVSYYNEGVKEGIKLTEDEQETIQSQIESIEDAASSSELSVNEYCEQNYGTYCGIKTIEKILEMNYIGQTYYYEAQIGFSPTLEETEAYAEENSETYMSCEFAYLEMEYDMTDDDTMATSIAQAEEYCNEISDVDELIALIPDALGDLIDEYVSYGYFSSEEEAVEQFSEQVVITETKTDLASMLGDDIADWLFDDNTPIGDTNYAVDSDYGYIYILLKTAEPAFDETEVYSVRHILITPGSDSDDEDADTEDTDTEEDTEETDETESEDTDYTEEDWDAAYEKAQSILDEYNNGEKTEQAFAALAEEYSDDTESTSSGSSGIYGGLYEDTSLGEMVSEFEDWATDSERQEGDTDIVKSDYGYHIMYFIFDGPTYLYNASADLKSENETAFINSCTAKIKKPGFKNTNKADPTTETTTETTTSATTDETTNETE